MPRSVSPVCRPVTLTGVIIVPGTLLSKVSSLLVVVMPIRSSAPARPGLIAKASHAKHATLAVNCLSIAQFEV